jgi:antitoxin (DNA-binding transcriptional repressor) of toxin-antitoxin stability system
MITVSKSVLKSKMLEYFRRVEEEGEELIVTHNQVPVLRVVSLCGKRPAADVFAGVRGKVIYRQDINEPTVGEWPEV